jgi:tryptophanyl-tRNA synthetase
MTTEVKEQKITPEGVVGDGVSINYDKIIDQFGVSLIDNNLKARFEKLTGKKLHYLIERGIFFSHMDLDKILDAYENKKPIYIYTGRGPSTNSMHLGHLIPFMLTKYLQDALEAIVVIQMSDSEKFFFKENTKIEDLVENSYSNAKDIIACGFNPNKTYIFSDYETGGQSYKLLVKMFKLVNINQLKSTYGFTDQDNLGKFIWPICQSAVSYACVFDFLPKDAMCIIPAAIDQSPYLRLARDLAPKLKLRKPALILGKFLPSLKGLNYKMSSTSTNQKNDQPIFLSDDISIIKKKIAVAASGGRETLELQKELGANLDIDVAYHYMLYLEEDQNIIDHITKDYGSGKLSTGELKQLLVTRISSIINNHKEKIEQLTEKEFKMFFMKK